MWLQNKGHTARVLKIGKYDIDGKRYSCFPRRFGQSRQNYGNLYQLIMYHLG